MWADDRYWLPLLLRGELFRGYFVFDGETLCDRRIETLPSEFVFEETPAIREAHAPRGSG